MANVMMDTKMFQKILLSACAGALFAGTATAATIGSFTFDDNAFADNAVIALTTGTPADSPASAADGDLSTATNLNDSFVELFFTDNVLFNGVGDDLVIFGGTNNNVIRLYGAADDNTPWLQGTNNFVPSGAAGNTSGFSLNGATFDLSDLGFADGEEVTSGLFISRGGIFTTVWDVAALNSRDVQTPPPPSPIPLPAGMPLLVAGLGGLALLRRRAKS